MFKHPELGISKIYVYLFSLPDYRFPSRARH
jgi:hypothetical protein